MKKLLFAIAGAAAFAAFAADSEVTGRSGDISFVGFEKYTADQTVLGYDDDGAAGNSLWLSTGEDASLVKAYGDEVAAPTIAVPAPFEDGGEKYLALDTNGNELQRYINADKAATTVAAAGTYIDTLVQFTPSESAPSTNDLAGAKLAIWLGVDSESNTTNLYVQGGFMVGPVDEGTVTIDTTDTRAYKLGNLQVVAGQWYRLTVKAVTIDDDGAGSVISGFQIRIDGTLAVSDAEVCDAAAIQYYTDYATEDGIFPGVAGLLTDKTIIPSCAGVLAESTLTSVGFKGTGALDDFVVTTETPDFTPPPVDFTLTWPEGYTAVSYTVDGGTPVEIDANTTFPFSVQAGSTVAFTFRNADGVLKTTAPVTASSEVKSIDAANETFTWADYLGEAVDGAYTIDDFDDLDLLRKGVAFSLATAGETFKQTADIDMKSAGAFAGIGTYAADLTKGVAFAGTYDGQGHKISNVDFAQRNYGGVFNQVKGGTIKDLTVENITCSEFSAEVNSGEWGGAIVGNAGLGATLQGLVAAGSFGTSAIPCTHNVAGIAIRVCGGGDNTETLVKDCTNNAALYGTYTKVGGITALTQDQNGVADDYVLFDGCVNNGALNLIRDADKVTGIAGIVGYVSDGTKLKDCVNTGTITITGTANTDTKGELVGQGYNQFLTDVGGNTAPSSGKMVGKYNAATVTGFLYATVENGVATTVTTLAKDTTYLLEGNVAASETPVFTLAAAGDTIAFNTALGYTFAGTVASAEGLTVSDATVGTVTTYTAAEQQAEDGWVEDSSTIEEGTSAAEQYAALANSDLATADAKKLTDWAKANNAAFTAVTAAPGDFVEAFLLNCAPTAEAVAAEKAAFVLDIEVDGDTVTVKLPEGKTYNGKLQMKGSADLSTWEPVNATSSDYNFYKYELSL